MRVRRAPNVSRGIGRINTEPTRGHGAGGARGHGLQLLTHTHLLQPLSIQQAAGVTNDSSARGPTGSTDTRGKGGRGSTSFVKAPCPPGASV